MTHSVSWTGPARRDMARLPDRVATAVVVFVDERLAHAPLRLSKPLSGDLADLRSARSGDYRVLFRLLEGLQVIEVVHVDHRAHAYRPG
ncbi:MAG TPA: type II toxin-antitoxin system RelE/ParE family toxin [Candidatus Lustribacter sp.]|nr:type II toxin-antitoxin system RelE/ParE family toxin [Candidatus Lustribacter sp.]